MRRMRGSFLSAFVVGLAALALSWAYQAPTGEFIVYFGTYTGFKYTTKGVPTGRSLSKGIYVCRFKPATGEASEPRLAAEIRNPSFIAIHPNQRFLYSVSEDPLSLGPSRDKGSYVSAFAIDRATGMLNPLNTVPSGGTSTCYVSLDQTGRYVLVANYGSGSVSVLRVNSDGLLGAQTGFIQLTGHGVDPSYQTGPHAHSIDVSPDNRFAVVADLGTDRVLVYRFDAASGSLTANDPPFVEVTPPGAGPRHFTFAPGGKFAYLISEMSGIVTAYAWDPARGVLTEIQATHTFPPDFNVDQSAKVLNPFRSAEVGVHPGGRFVYESNRGSDTMGVFAVDTNKGTLTPVQQVSTRGMTPRHFAIDPTGAYLLVANQITDGVVIFRIEAKTGRISPMRSVVKVDTPVCVRFAKANWGPVRHRTKQ